MLVNIGVSVFHIALTVNHAEFNIMSTLYPALCIWHFTATLVCIHCASSHHHPMPVNYLRNISGQTRNQNDDLALARYLIFVAGAVNAGGLLAVAQYTSHMSGIVASIADNMAVGNSQIALAGLGALLSFLAGAASTAMLVNWGRRQSLNSVYALPLLVESILLLCFGIAGANLNIHMGLFVSMTVMLLCFIMGLQNALITKISKAEIRTTHVTGLITDMGIELGKLFYWNIARHPRVAQKVMADKNKIRVLASLVSLFFFGGVTGALGFKYVGFGFTIPLAALVLLLAIMPIFDDVNSRLRRSK